MLLGLVTNYREHSASQNKMNIHMAAVLKSSKTFLMVLKYKCAKCGALVQRVTISLKCGHKRLYY